MSVRGASRFLEFLHVFMVVRYMIVIRITILMGIFSGDDVILGLNSVYDYRYNKF